MKNKLYSLIWFWVFIVGGVILLIVANSYIADSHGVIHKGVRNTLLGAFGCFTLAIISAYSYVKKIFLEYKNRIEQLENKLKQKSK